MPQKKLTQTLMEAKILQSMLLSTEYLAAFLKHYQLIPAFKNLLLGKTT